MSQERSYIRALFVFLLLYAFALPVLNSNANNYKDIDLQSADLKKQISQVIAKSGQEDLDVGIMVQSLNKNSSFAYHSKRMFMPASVTKLFLSFAAMSYLGPEYKFITSISSNKKVRENGV